MNHIGPKMDQKRLKIVFLYNCLFAEILFAQHTLSEEIILNEVSLGGSPTVDFALQLSTLLCNISSSWATYYLQLSFDHTFHQQSSLITKLPSSCLKAVTKLLSCCPRTVIKLAPTKCHQAAQKE